MMTRKLEKSDKNKWMEMFRGMSAEALENRYHHHVDTSDKSIEFYWLNVLDTDSIVAIMDDKIVGSVELYTYQNCRDCDIGIMVNDKYHGLGIGSSLMREIELLAKDKHLVSIIMDILPS